MTSIFIASFLNTGVVLLLTNANLENTFLNFLPIKNQFPDFTRDWYIVVGGSLTQTVLLLAFMPYIEIIIALTIKKIKRGLDSGFPCCPRGAG